MNPYNKTVAIMCAFFPLASALSAHETDSYFPVFSPEPVMMPSDRRLGRIAPTKDEIDVFKATEIIQDAWVRLIKISIAGSGNVRPYSLLGVMYHRSLALQEPKKARGFEALKDFLSLNLERMKRAVCSAEADTLQFQTPYGIIPLKHAPSLFKQCLQDRFNTEQWYIDHYSKALAADNSNAFLQALKKFHEKNNEAAGKLINIMKDVERVAGNVRDLYASREDYTGVVYSLGGLISGLGFLLGDNPRSARNHIEDAAVVSVDGLELSPLEILILLMSDINDRRLEIKQVLFDLEGERAGAYGDAGKILEDKIAYYEARHQEIVAKEVPYADLLLYVLPRTYISTYRNSTFCPFVDMSKR